jgi:hypothetical protein
MLIAEDARKKAGAEAMKTMAGEHPGQVAILERVA